MITMISQDINLSYKLEVLISEAIEKLGLELKSSDKNQAKYKSSVTGDVILVHYNERTNEYELYTVNELVDEVPEDLLNHLIITEIQP